MTDQKATPCIRQTQPGTADHLNGPSMLKPEPRDDRLILVPFNPQEAISVAEAAERSGKSESTVRSWCVVHGIGRRVVDGHWQVSRVALQMLLEDDKKGLFAYHQGERTTPLVAEYFNRSGLSSPSSERSR